MFTNEPEKVYLIRGTHHLGIVKLTPSKLKPLRVTNIQRESESTQLAQRDEDFREEQAKGVYPYPWIGECMFEMEETHVDWDLYDRSHKQPQGNCMDTSGSPLNQVQPTCTTATRHQL